MTEAIERAARAWQPLEENADERRMFNEATNVLADGNAFLYIAQTLAMWSRMAPAGSYGCMLAIMANKVAKLATLAEPTAAQIEAMTDGILDEMQAHNDRRVMFSGYFPRELYRDGIRDYARAAHRALMADLLGGK